MPIRMPATSVMKIMLWKWNPTCMPVYPVKPVMVRVLPITRNPIHQGSWCLINVNFAVYAISAILTVKKLAQIDLKEHYPEKKCIECHNPHLPWDITE